MRCYTKLNLSYHNKSWGFQIMTNKPSSNVNQNHKEAMRKKTPYHSPILQTYGTVGQLTAGGGGTETDGNNMPHTMSDRRAKENIACLTG
jgi:hypothetical protein